MTMNIDTPYRKIATEIPSRTTARLMEELQLHEPRSMAGFLPVAFREAKGFQVYDDSGNMWLDFSSAVVLTNAGHADPTIKAYIQEQLDSDMWHCYCNPSEARLHTLQALKQILPPYLDRALLLSTGAESTECAIKLARIYGQTVSKDKYVFVSYDNSFHGRTMGAQIAGGFMSQQAWMGQKPGGFYHIPYPECARCPFGKKGYGNCGRECFQKTRQLMKKDGIREETICGIMTETFQGPTVAFMPPDYVRELKRFTEEIHALLIFDEVQAGFGRTGRWFGFEHYGVEPDLIAMAKGMSSCLPAAAVAGRKEIMNLPAHGEMSSTHTGNPLCVAAVRGNIEAIRKGGMVENAARLEREVIAPFRDELYEEFGDRIAAFNGHGLVWGICIREAGGAGFDVAACNRICQFCLERGLMMIQTGRGTLKIAPPLCITPEAMRDGLHLIREAMRETLR